MKQSNTVLTSIGMSISLGAILFLAACGGGGGGGSDGGGGGGGDKLPGGGHGGSTQPKVAVSGEHSLTIDADGSLWGWGADGAGQLGQGANAHFTRRSPFQIGSDRDWVRVGASQTSTVAIKSNGSLWFAGTPAATSEFAKTMTRAGTDSNWSELATGSLHTLLLKSDRSMWAWGSNRYGQLGLGDNERRTTPTRIGTANDWSKIAAGEQHSLAIKADGSLWAWGSNEYGQLGLGDTDDRNVPTRVGAATDWSTAAAGGTHSLAIKSDGTLWAWGNNWFGQIGTGPFPIGDHHDNKSIPTPVQVGSASNWTIPVAGSKSSFAIQSDGTLWSWGSNQHGHLGYGNYDGAYEPTQIGTGTDWISVSHGSNFGSTHTVALKKDGSKWAWGGNTYGQLGMGDTTTRLTPTKVPDAPPSAGGGGGNACLIASWKTPTCSGRKQQTLLFKPDGTGSFTNPDCNDICNPIVFGFNYTVSGSNVTLNYGVPAPVYCTGYGTQQPPQPSNDSFSFSCSTTQLTTTTTAGTATYTK